MQYCTRNPTIKKPELSDPASIIDINDNMDVIDGIICKSNFNGATDPGVGDDIVDGYSVGSNWWNVTDHRLFVAESVATGSAVWRQVYPTIDVIDGLINKNNFNGAVDPGTGDDIVDGYAVGSNWWNVTGHKLFVAESVATGSAVWRQVYPTIDAPNHNLATAANDFLVASGAGVYVKKTLLETQDILGCRPTGWVVAPALTFSAADAPVYTVTCSGDYTYIIPVGAKIALTHSSSTKYFIVVNVSYSSPNTTFTLYGGTDYTLDAGAITDPYYSIAKAPIGFPLDPTKWTVTVTDSTQRSKTTDISDSTWYNIDAAARISVPIGIWNVSYMVYGSSSVTATPAWHNVRVCLSSSPSSCSDNLSLQEHLVLTDLDNNVLSVATFKVVTTAKTTYYVNIQCHASTAITLLRYYNDLYPMVIKAECTYL